MPTSDDLPTLDKIDARILRALQADGRISNLKLAEAVHLCLLYTSDAADE